MDWDDHAADWDHQPAVKAYAAAVFGRLKTLVDQENRRLAEFRVLDFGCGTGLLSEALAGECQRVVGLDPSAKMIAGLVNKIAANNWDHVEASSGTLEIALANGDLRRDAKFDLLVCSSVCAFLEDYPGTLDLLASLLGPGGLFVQFDWERDASANDPFGLSRAEMTAALAGAGLEIVCVEIGFERAVGEQVMKPLMGVGRAND